MAGVLHRVEVIQVPEELVETMYRGKELVPVTKVVFPKLASGITHRLEYRCNRGGLIGHSEWRTRLTHRCQAGANREFASDEIRTSGRAARLGVVVSEPHSFVGELVQIRRAAGHDALVVDADVGPTDVVAHYEDY